MKSVASIDWLTMTFKGADDPRKVAQDRLSMDADLFDLKPFGKFGYRQSLEFGGIMVYFDPPEDRVADMGVCVSMSGTGCRTFEAHSALSFDGLFRALHVDPLVHFTRVDLALDDREQLLDLEVIAEAVRANDINSRIRYRTIYQGYDGTRQGGTTVYIGAANSDFRIRIYDKAKEMYKPCDPEYNKHWVRFEIVMRGANAMGFVAAYCNTDDLGCLASGILNDKLAFINRDDGNISRCSICDWWLAFVDRVAAIKLVSREETRHKIEDTLDWVKRQIAPSLSIVEAAFGFFAIRDILAIGTDKRSRQQQALLDDYFKVKRCEVSANCNKTGYFDGLGGGAVHYT